jgi:hypothetical protein
MSQLPFDPGHYFFLFDQLHSVDSTIDLRQCRIDGLALTDGGPRNERRFIRFVPLSTKNTAVM